MWRRTMLIVAVGITLATRDTSDAQQRGQECDGSELLISGLNWVRFDVAMGRVMATSNRTKQDRQRARRDLPDGGSECLTVTIDRGLISLHYCLENDSRQLTICVVRRDDMEIRWTRKQTDGEPVTAVYTQSRVGDVSMVVCGAEQTEQVYRASSLWHLAIAHPDVCESHLVGALQSLRPDWQLLDDARAIRTSLFHSPLRQATTSLSEVRLLVMQLADPDFRVRQRADREIQSRGRCVLAVLNELDLQDLDAEQRLRIAGIRRAIEADHVDTPDRVAAWLINDKRVWLALLNDDDSRRRHVARQQLARICEHSIDFDPAATRTERAEQIAVLHTQLLRR